MRNLESFPSEKHLAVEIKKLIDQSRQEVSVAVNSAEIFPAVAIVHTLCTQFTVEYCKGWCEKQLRQYMTFVQPFLEKEVLYTLCRQLS